MNLDWLRGLWIPETDWIQVEVTSFCNADCLHCPHTVLRDVWRDRHMPLEVFSELKGAFAKTKLVYLQGWGEPLLHPDFFAMAAIAKSAGCQVGTTTNGTLVDAGAAKQIIDTKLDFAAFSLAGLDERNDSVRQGTSAERVLSGIEAVRREKEQRNLSTPLISVAYLLLRSGVDDLERIPSALRGSGVDQVVISTLDFVPSPDLEEESFLYASQSEIQETRQRLDRLVESGPDSGIDIHYHLGISGKLKGDCLENAPRSLFVGSDGTVSPCVFANLPISSVPDLTKGARRPYRETAYGHISEDRIGAIWGKKEYARLRQAFPEGPLHELCAGCPKIK